MEFVVPTLFGLEALTAKELRFMGYENVTVTDGRVLFSGEPSAAARANIRLRTGERVLFKVGSFHAETFDDLFEGTKALPWRDFLPKDAQFPVKGGSVRSKLFSVSDCQAIIKKAIVESMKKEYKIDWFQETGDLYQVQFAIMKDEVTIMLDLSGTGLRKRGYRPASNDAPLRETIAAGLVMLSGWRASEVLADPFCGSGTIPIEAAMWARHIAPGLSRSFAGEKHAYLPKEIWEEEKERAKADIRDVDFVIFASDLDKNCVSLTDKNSTLAGVRENIRITKRDATEFFSKTPGGCLICNPPYGERMGDKKEAEELYRGMGKAFLQLPEWRINVITAHEGFERFFGKKSDKKRKLYNGMLKCYLYQYRT